MYIALPYLTAQVLAAESQSTEDWSINEGEAPPSIIISETDMDTQPTVSMSPPPSREGSEMPQVSQSQEVIQAVGYKYCIQGPALFSCIVHKHCIGLQSRF